MKSNLYFLVLLFVALSSCKKDGGDNNNNNNNPDSLSGLWYKLPGLETPDYATSVGPFVWLNNKCHSLVFNKFFRVKYLEVNEDKTTTLVSTPFENEQHITFPCMATDGSDVFVSYGLNLGDLKIYSFLRSGNTWTTLPEITWSNYSFNNRVMAAAMVNGQPYLLAQSVDSTYIFTYENTVWTALGGKAIGPTYYYVDLKANGGRIISLGYNPPSGNNAGLFINEWNGSQWEDAGFVLSNPGDEIIYPNMDISPSGAVLLNYLSYNGSFIYKQETGGAVWQKVFERDASLDFAFKARFDRENPAVFYAVRVSHPVQISHAIWGLIKFNGLETQELSISPDTDVPNYDVIFDPVLYTTMELIPHNKKIHFSYTEDRNPIMGHFVLFEEN